MLGVRLAANPALGQRPAFAIFTLAVVLSAAFAGPGPAIFASLLSIALVMLFVTGDWSGETLTLEITLFLITALAVVWLGRVFQAARIRAESAFVELEGKATALADSEAHLRSIIDAVPDALVICKADGSITSFSRASERLFGHAASEMLGRDVAEVLPDLSMNQEMRGHNSDESECPTSTNPWKTCFGRRKDGSTIPVEVCVGEMKAANQMLCACFIRDISSRRATEAHLQNMQMELHHMSRLSAVGEMASALAHEINQPLSAIANYLRGASRILRDDQVELPSTAADAIRKAGRQALRAGEIIRRLRDFVTQRDSDKRNEFLPKLIEDSSALALVGAREAGIDVRWDLSPDAEWVLVDRVQIQQVLVNLIRNALDAMTDSRDGELVISTRLESSGMALISISDNGPGVAPELYQTLFQPFVTTKARGMGIGLSISRSICEAHGGRLWMEPRKGGGAVFCLTLPLAVSVEAIRHG